ncbi:uncharacterized protein isoform X2 [Choristoneura fumiferana]|uniref:uncharacterized protein isoform X2 n=1 Tax=Choristoneura fumiferana TaxID=7141 RepID=UPI003D15A7FE
MAVCKRKTISINFDRSDASFKHYFGASRHPTVGKVYERNKPRKAPSPTWEIRSAYPLRQNIWEYLNEDKSEENFNCSSKRRTRGTCCKQTDGQGKAAPNNKMWLFLFFGLVCFVLISYSRLSDFVLQSKFITKVVPKTRLISLLYSEPSVEEECCHVMKSLAASLLRAEQALRNTQRIRRLMLISSGTSKTASSSPYERDYIGDATVMRGTDTKEWGGRVALWGILPLWRASPPPSTVLALRKPVPSDCWPFSGSRGEMIIRLEQPTKVRCISIEHVRPDTAKSAPKDFILYGIEENGTWTKSIEAEYKNYGPAKQFFKLMPNNATSQRFVLRILTNQGNLKYTCVYRVHMYKNVES